MSGWSWSIPCWAFRNDIETNFDANLHKTATLPPSEARVSTQRHQVPHRLCFLNTSPQAKWVAAPLLITRKCPTIFCLMTDYRAINSTSQKSRPTPHLKYVLSKIRGAFISVSLDFCFGYWQLKFTGSSQSLYFFTTTDVLVQPARTTQGGCSSADNVEARVTPSLLNSETTFPAWWVTLLCTKTPSLYTWTSWRNFSVFSLIAFWLFRLLICVSIPNQ